MKIAADKWRHFYAGIAMGFVLQAIGRGLLPDQPWLAGMLVFAIVVAVSYGFELFSKITGLGRYDVMDAVASAIGGLIGMLLFIFIMFCLHYYSFL